MMPKCLRALVFHPHGKLPDCLHLTIMHHQESHLNQPGNR